MKEETKKKIKGSLKKYYSDSSARRKLSKSLKKYYSNPEIRERIANERRKYWAEKPKIKRKKTKLWKEKMSSVSYRKKMSRIKKKQYAENKNIVEKIDKAMTGWWHNHPNVKKERSEKIKKLFIKYPDKFRKFMQYGNNPSLPRFRTKQNFLVRSRGEQEIANFLYDNKISCFYESKTLIFEKEGQICVPDFYLPSYKKYIEFYGGYPAAYKKKVLKNKLYKKHKIPCIFITPSELRDLDYYLKKELRK